MTIRIAGIDDIPELHRIRTAVIENSLSDPGFITAADYTEFLTRRGCGWTADIQGVIAGFAIADLQDHNIWALFVAPAAEGKGVGKALHRQMLAWYFSKTQETVWLSTALGTRAEHFYRAASWIENGLHGQQEIRFEMSFENWKNNYQ